MPRFLGLDYFKEASGNYLRRVSEFTLAEPWHLELENPYIHVRKSADKLFFRPWTKVIVDPLLLQKEGEDIPEDFSEIIQDFDPFETTTYQKLSGVIPSSLEEDETSHQVGELMTTVVDSSKSKDFTAAYDLHKLKDALQRGHKWCVEEPLVLNCLIDLHPINHEVDIEFSAPNCSIAASDEIRTMDTENVLFQKYHTHNNPVSSVNANEPFHKKENNKDDEHVPLPNLMKHEDDHILELCNSVSAPNQKSGTGNSIIKQKRDLTTEMPASVGIGCQILNRISTAKEIVSPIEITRTSESTNHKSSSCSQGVINCNTNALTLSPLLHSMNSSFTTSCDDLPHLDDSKISSSLQCSSQCVEQPMNDCKECEETQVNNPINVPQIFVSASQTSVRQDKNSSVNQINQARLSITNDDVHYINSDKNEVKNMEDSIADNLIGFHPEARKTATADVIINWTPKALDPILKQNELTHSETLTTMKSNSEINISNHKTVSQNFENSLDEINFLSDSCDKEDTVADINSKENAKDCVINSSDSLLQELLKMKSLASESVSDINANDFSSKTFERNIGFTSTPVDTPKDCQIAKLNDTIRSVKTLDEINLSDQPQITQIGKAVGLVNPTPHVESGVQVKSKQQSRTEDTEGFQLCCYNIGYNNQHKETVLMSDLEYFLMMRGEHNKKMNIKRKSLLPSHGDIKICKEKKPKLVPKPLLPVGSNTSSMNNKIAPSYEWINLIGSPLIINNLELITTLETRYNVEFVERNYEVIFKLHHANVASSMFFADLIFDERTALVLVELTDLQDREYLQNLRIKVYHLIRKFAICWILVSHSTSSSLSLKPSFLKTLSKLSSWASLLSRNKVEIQIKVVFCNSILQLATIIRNICDLTVKDHQFSKFTRLLPEISEHEKFLLTFPCINSFSAQTILSLMTLQELFTSSLESLKSKLRCLPLHSLKMLYDIIHWTSPVHNFCMQKAENEEAQQLLTAAVTEMISDDEKEETNYTLNECSNHSLVTREAFKHMHHQSIDSAIQQNGGQTMTSPVPVVVAEDRLLDAYSMIDECHCKSLACTESEATTHQVPGPRVLSPPMELPKNWSKSAHIWNSRTCNPQLPAPPFINICRHRLPPCIKGYSSAKPELGLSYELHEPSLFNPALPDCSMTIYNPPPFEANVYGQRMWNYADFGSNFMTPEQMQTHPVAMGFFPTVFSNSLIPNLYSEEVTSDTHRTMNVGQWPENSITSQYFRHSNIKPAMPDEMSCNYSGCSNDFIKNWQSQIRNAVLVGQGLGTNEKGLKGKCQMLSQIQRHHHLCYEKVPGNNGQTRLKFI